MVVFKDDKIIIQFNDCFPQHKVQEIDYDF